MKITPADRYFSQWVRLTQKKCQKCDSLVKINAKGLPVSHQASHFKGRIKQGTRFEEKNVDCLCGGCHMYFTAQPDEHYQWQVKTKGQKTVDKIILQASTYHKKNYELEAIYWRRKLKEDFNI